MACDSALLKWKWDDLRSVDLVAVETNDGGGGSTGDGLGSGIRLFCDGDEGMQIDCSKRGSGSVALGTFDTLRLRADMQDFLAENMGIGGKSAIKDRRGRIAEVVYNTSLGVWGYKLLRRDKSDPNHIYTFLGVCMEQADGISIEELEYRLIGCASSSVGSGGSTTESITIPALDDDYQFQLQRMKGQLLNWRKEGALKRSVGGGASQNSK